MDMYERIQDKMKFEYEAFRCMMLAGSREKLYASAKEVMLKKFIFDTICGRRIRLKHYSEEDFKNLLLESNLLDHIYLYLSEQPMEQVMRPTAIDSKMKQIVAGR